MRVTPTISTKNLTSSNLMTRFHVLDWAIKDQAKYVIITSGGDYDNISFETNKKCAK